MHLDKLALSDPKTVAAVVAIGVLGLGMCVHLVFLFADLFKSVAFSPSRARCGQGLTLVHFSAQLEPSLTENTP
jgi:hypothetical protein